MKRDNYRFVSDYWNYEEAKSLSNDEVGLLLYRSNKLGQDLRITNYGGGNTSCKVLAKDPLSGKEKEVMYVKGSGGDIGTLKRDGLSSLYMDRLLSLENVYRGIDFEDEMVGMYQHCIYDLDSRAPSIDTPLHAYLPFKHIDHLHADSMITIAASKNGKEITKEIWKGKMGWVEWQRPGFDLALQLRNELNKNPGIEGIMLGGHGFFTWGNTSEECYYRSLNVIEDASIFIEENSNELTFGGAKIKSLNKEKRNEQAAFIAPVLRGLCSSKRSMIGHFTDDERVLEFINSKDLEKLAPLGTSCPDHFLRTKIRPLLLNLLPEEDLTDTSIISDKLEKQFIEYRKAYTEYYETHKHDNSPAMRDANPVIILYPGVGMFSFAKNKQTARVASEFYINAINVMRGANSISEYVSLPLQEAFDIEYWLLEEAKLQRMPKPKELTGKVALITGGGGGIGKAIADKIVEQGGVVVITDINIENLSKAEKTFKNDEFASSTCDVTDENSVEEAFKKAVLAFGGIDIVVNSAGVAVSKKLEDTSEEDWDFVQNILVKGQFFINKVGTKILRKQKKGGDIINIVSKNALVAGPNNVGYGTSKAAQLHMSRLLAAELGVDKIRVNVVNPDAVIVGSKIWEGKWAEGRAKAYGIEVKDLPAYYAKRTLLNEIILPEDIANACVGILINMKKSTGNIINVDGGVAAAFPR